MIRVLAVLVLGVASLTACGKKLPFPDQSTVAASTPLPIDGEWRLLTGNTTAVFKIDRGRMFYFDKQKPPRGLRRESEASLSSEYRSATDYSRLPGNVIAMNIRDAGEPGQYYCKTAVYNTSTRGLEFVTGQIVESPDGRVLLRAFSGAGSSKVITVEDHFVRSGASPIAGVKPGQAQGGSAYDSSGGSQVAARKATVIPQEKMEADGQLSPSAKDFIRQTVSNSKAADGAVEIRYPPRTSRRIVKALRALGAEVAEGVGSEYEVIVILIKPGSR